MALLEIRDLAKSYPTAAGPLEVLRGVSFDVTAGEVVAVVGESGTGKSTLLHLIGALDRPSHGSIRYQGQDVFAKSDDDLATFRNEHVGFVFQFHHLLPEFSALENVCMPALIKGRKLRDVEGRARQLLTMLGLSARENHRPGQLSCGEQQRVAVARAMMNEPGLILADEPTGNLDMTTAERLHNEMLRLSRELNQTFVIVTHNPALADLADRVLHLEAGLLVNGETLPNDGHAGALND
jgi:lipoprotein-releasing system ATP-binding protein